MQSFRYLRDPLFITCVMLYFINRWLVKPYTDNTFSHAYFNDLICIPFWVPIMLSAMRLVRLRRHNRPPEAHEILIPLLMWSWMFECLVPYTDRFRGIAFADPLDILCYTTGALLAAVFWALWYRPARLAAA